MAGALEPHPHNRGLARASRSAAVAVPQCQQDLFIGQIEPISVIARQKPYPFVCLTGVSLEAQREFLEISGEFCLPAG
jgi:hypothetical protein